VLQCLRFFVNNSFFQESDESAQNLDQIDPTFLGGEVDQSDLGEAGVDAPVLVEEYVEEAKSIVTEGNTAVGGEMSASISTGVDGMATEVDNSIAIGDHTQEHVAEAVIEPVKSISETLPASVEESPV
jgi:hypothetical protein